MQNASLHAPPLVPSSRDRSSWFLCSPADRGLNAPLQPTLTGRFAISAVPKLGGPIPVLLCLFDVATLILVASPLPGALERSRPTRREILPLGGPDHERLVLQNLPAGERSLLVVHRCDQIQLHQIDCRDLDQVINCPSGRALLVKYNTREARRKVHQFVQSLRLNATQRRRDTTMVHAARSSTQGVLEMDTRV